MSLALRLFTLLWKDTDLLSQYLGGLGEENEKFKVAPVWDTDFYFTNREHEWGARNARRALGQHCTYTAKVIYYLLGARMCDR